MSSGESGDRESKSFQSATTASYEYKATTVQSQFGSVKRHSTFDETRRDLHPPSGWTFTMPLSSMFAPGQLLVLLLRLRDFRLDDWDEGREVEDIEATECPS